MLTILFAVAVAFRKCDAVKIDAQNKSWNETQLSIILGSGAYGCARIPIEVLDWGMQQQTDTEHIDVLGKQV